MFVYLSIGTNIQPEENAVHIVRELCQHFGVITLYPFIYTQPVSMPEASIFLNSLAIIRTETPQKKIKEILNEIETKLGRDRSDPNRSYKNRTADIDILHIDANLDENHFLHGHEESYIKLCLSQKHACADLRQEGLPSYQRPTSVHWDRSTRKILVRQNEL